MPDHVCVQCKQLLFPGLWQSSNDTKGCGVLMQCIPVLGLQVCLVQSFTDAQKWALLAACTAVVYTPEGEHFGIVPLEAMACSRPVIAVNSGGPRETVVHGRTGLLCTADPLAFARGMATLAVRAPRCSVNLSMSCCTLW